MAGLDVKVSQLGEVVVTSDNDLLNLVTYDEQNQTYVSGKVKTSTLKSYIVDDLDVSDLHDTTITTPTNDDGLVYNSTSQKWENKQITTKEQWQETGAYNLLRPGHASISDYGALFTENANGTVTKSGTVSGGNAQYVYVVPTNEPYTPVADLIPGRKYKLVGCPSGGGDNLYEIYIQYRNADNTGWAETYHDYGSGVVFTAKEARFGVYIRVFNGNTDTLNFKPMITSDLNATYDDYQPHAKTNRELTEDTIVKEIAPSSLSSANARISLETLDNIVIRKIGRLVVIEKLGIIISAGADLPYNVGVLITGLPAPDSAKCVLMATGNRNADYKSVGFTVNANGSLIPASFNDIPANANNQAAYFIGGASYIAKE